MKKDDDAHKTHTQAEARNRVLVVSLQTGLVPLLRFLLSADGLEVVTAQEPRDVLEKLGSTGAKILLLDLHLPTANAMRLLETIRVSCPQVFVITMAESACRELAVESIGVGANGFLLEPLDFRILRSLLYRRIGETFANETPQPLIKLREQVSCR
ncbi:MAG: hypothetical protein DMG06_01420 [Acidobacteria bacterium]|nr:MAG: hypothetical protein DMG06_01420 [Acidobacteriota bacterium]